MSEPQVPKSLRHAADIVKAGEAIYSEQHKAVLEPKFAGHFAAIDVLTGKAYVRQYPEEALLTAREDNPRGIFHLIKIGSPGAFKVSFFSARSSGDHRNWAF